MDTGPMNPANWTHKKGLNPKEQPFNILASVLTAPLNQIAKVSSSFGHVRILLDNWHQRQPLSGTKVNIGRSIHRKSVFRCDCYNRDAADNASLRRPSVSESQITPGMGAGAVTSKHTLSVYRPKECMPDPTQISLCMFKSGFIIHLECVFIPRLAG